MRNIRSIAAHIPLGSYSYASLIEETFKQFNNEAVTRLTQPNPELMDDLIIRHIEGVLEVLAIIGYINGKDNVLVKQAKLFKTLNKQRPLAEVRPARTLAAPAAAPYYPRPQSGYQPYSFPQRGGWYGPRQLPPQYPTRPTIRCEYCQCTGHQESNCYKKRDGAPRGDYSRQARLRSHGMLPQP